MQNNSMKNQLIFFVLFVLAGTNLQAQNLTNYDFEKWSFYDSFEKPDGWSTSNFSVFSVITFHPVTRESSDVYSGENSLKLVTLEKNVGGDQVKVVGLVTLGKFDIDTTLVAGCATAYQSTGFPTICCSARLMQLPSWV